MKDFDKIEDSLIDEFYNEEYEKVDKNLEYSDKYTKFKSKLSSTGEKMAVLNEDTFDFDIDTLGIIEQGEYIRENRKAKKEFLMFILSSFIILSLYVASIIKMGAKILIISQIVIIILAPSIIILSLIAKRRRREV